MSVIIITILIAIVIIAIVRTMINVILIKTGRRRRQHRPQEQMQKYLRTTLAYEQKITFVTLRTIQIDKIYVLHISKVICH